MELARFRSCACACARCNARTAECVPVSALVTPARPLASSKYAPPVCSAPSTLRDLLRIGSCPCNSCPITGPCHRPRHVITLRTTTGRWGLISHEAYLMAMGCMLASSSPLDGAQLQRDFVNVELEYWHTHLRSPVPYAHISHVPHGITKAHVARRRGDDSRCTLIDGMKSTTMP